MKVIPTVKPFIRVGNLADALALAIEVRLTYEKKMGYSQPSARLKGWMDTLKAINNGEIPEVRP